MATKSSASTDTVVESAPRIMETNNELDQSRSFISGGVTLDDRASVGDRRMRHNSKAAPISAQSTDIQERPPRRTAWEKANATMSGGILRSIKKLLSASAFVNPDEGIIQLDLDGGDGDDDGTHYGFFRQTRARMGAAIKSDEPRRTVYTAQSDAEGSTLAETSTSMIMSHADKFKGRMKEWKPSAQKLKKLEKSRRRVKERGVPKLNIVMFIVGSRGGSLFLPMLQIPSESASQLTSE